MKKNILPLILAVVCFFVCSLSAVASDVTYCYACEEEAVFVIDYEYINDRYHAVRYRCMECGYDLRGGCDIRQHNGDQCIYCEEMAAPDGLNYYVYDDGILIVFNEVLEADRYTVALYEDIPFNGCKFLETETNWIWLPYNTYSWLTHGTEYKIRVQSVAAYQASKFSDPVEIVR